MAKQEFPYSHREDNPFQFLRPIIPVLLVLVGALTLLMRLMQVYPELYPEWLKQNLPNQRAAPVESQATPPADSQAIAPLADGRIGVFIASDIFYADYFVKDYQGLLVMMIIVVPDSPAEKAGLRDGDWIAAVDGEFLHSFVLATDSYAAWNALVAKITGQPGTEVRLRILRRYPEVKVFDVTITRVHVSVLERQQRVRP